jgi:hypothetical protein
MSLEQSEAINVTPVTFLRNFSLFVTNRQPEDLLRAIQLVIAAA